MAAVSSSTPGTLQGETIFLGPHEAVEVPVQGLLNSYRVNDVSRVTLTIKTDAPIGGIIGAVTQRDAKTGVMEDIPLKTGNPGKFMRGAYPLRWDQDYSNQPMISNTSDHTFSVRAYVIAKGVTYAFPLQDIAPGTTKLYDVDAIRQNGIKDVNGKVIPADALSGKFHWTPVGSDGFSGLLGRTELASRSDQRASSFSCSETCDLESYYFPYFSDDPFGDLSYQQVRQMSITEAYYDGYGNSVTYPIPYTAISSSNTSVINFVVDGEDNGSQSLVDEIGVTPGSSTLTYYFVTHSYSGPSESDFCHYYDNEEEFQGQPVTKPTVSISGTTNLPIYIDANYPGATIQLSATGNPGGGSYSWSADSSKITITNSGSSTATLKGTTAGQTPVAVQYTLNSQTGNDTKNVYVQAPTVSSISANSLNTYSNQTWTNCDSSGSAPNAYGYQRCVQYQILDQNSTSTPITGTYRVHEDVSILDTNIGSTMQTGDNQSNSNGIFQDQLAIIGTSQVPSNACSTVKQTLSVGSATIRVNCVHFSATDVAISNVTGSPASCTASCP